jgi:hypothetical protein
MAKGDKEDIRNAKRTAATKAKGGERQSASQIKAWNKAQRDANKAGKGVKVRATSSSSMTKSGGFKAANSVSATKPSVASKANAKNKMKAQGAKVMSSPTSGYGKSTKPKGR